MPNASLPTILLVEDEATDATLLLRGFRKARVLNPIVHLKDGDEALAYLAGVGHYSDRIKHPLPVLILLDLKLPGMSGLQLLQWLRLQKQIRRIPVVVLTIDDRAGTLNAAYDLGANSYLVKPGDPAQIGRVVESIQRYWIELNEPPPLVMGAKETT
ncbi:MAG TPA: response regulator [Terriglobales bacterium]|nr:response regulator [Terriglobales bacterium]HXF14879.1 response regulator [Terriglobales bacterium]